MEELKLGPITRTRMKKLNASNGKEDNDMIAYMEEVLKKKFEEFEGQGKTSKMFSICSINRNYSKEQFGVENWLKIPQSKKEVILGRIWIQFYNQKRIYIKVVSDALIDLFAWDCCSWFELVEEGEDKVEDDIIDPMKRFQDMKHSMKIIYVKIMEIILMLAKQTVVATMGIGLFKSNLPSSRSAVPKTQASTYKSWPKKEDTPKVAFNDHSKPKVEEKRKLITNPTRCFKCNGVGHIFINCPT
ncbi:hypothetical protein M9H77_27284 [Catharanthus roseus]|uniref:Uncharacterized protein n=1 Tax=Catharanthus roseus TaxID=4058 RepID=A0ACC0AD22_CATRO|nr:hypothetical protein M9H77_27284 [Catharanthus roseus]